LTERSVKILGVTLQFVDLFIAIRQLLSSTLLQIEKGGGELWLQAD
jgi:hypothetical protein